MTYVKEMVDISLLYVEDDELSRDGIYNTLKRKVRSIYLAKDGREGLELFKKNRPDVVITDIKMPGINGLDMARQILDIEPASEVIIASAFEDAQLFKKAIDLGVNKYLTKPIDVASVLYYLKRIEQRKIRERECTLLSSVLNSSSRIFWLNLDFELVKMNENAKNGGGELGITDKKLREMARLALENDGQFHDGDVIFSVAFNIAKEPKEFCVCVLDMKNG